MKFRGGLPETPCGAGSTVGYTEQLREALPLLLRMLGVTRLVDAPCGDFNWMSLVDLEGIDYVGCDINPDYLDIAEERPHRARSAQFYKLDMTRDRLPAADAVLCREFLQHFPFDSVHQILNLIQKRWLLCTSHMNAKNEDIYRIGDFRPLNLMRPPFNWPAPAFAIPDGEDRVIGAWRR